MPLSQLCRSFGNLMCRREIEQGGRSCIEFLLPYRWKSVHGERGAMKDVSPLDCSTHFQESFDFSELFCLTWMLSRFCILFDNLTTNSSWCYLISPKHEKSQPISSVHRELFPRPNNRGARLSKLKHPTQRAHPSSTPTHLPLRISPPIEFYMGQCEWQ